MRTRLSDLVGRLDGHGVELIDLIDSWCGEIERFRRELSLSLEEAPEAWGVLDLVASYNTRDRIERALGELDSEPPHCLELADTLLKSITTEIAIDWEQLGQTRSHGWWWSCFPTTGPVAEEFQRWQA